MLKTLYQNIKNGKKVVLTIFMINIGSNFVILYLLYLHKLKFMQKKIFWLYERYHTIIMSYLYQVYQSAHK